MTSIEKKWISYQILQGLRDARNRGISHGDIKSSNILVTSWNWVYVTDFATSYKPTYLPLNDPADFAFYFDTSGRRTCYVAPERFYDTHDQAKAKEGHVLESMDVFSAGCVIAELWLDGEPVFTLSGMFKYRSGEMGLAALFDKIQDEGVRVSAFAFQISRAYNCAFQSLLTSMTLLDPAARPTFDSVLQSSRGTLFPESFYSFLHNYISSINELRTPSPFAPRIDSSRSDPSLRNPGTSKTFPSDSDHRLERIWNEFDSVESYLFLLSEEAVTADEPMDPRIEYRAAGGSVGKPFTVSSHAVYFISSVTRLPRIFCLWCYTLQIEIHRFMESVQFPQAPKIQYRLQQVRPFTSISPANKSKILEDSPALIFLSLVLANLRNASFRSSKLHGMDVLLALSVHLTDETRLDRILPYLVDVLRDDDAIVRLSALRTLVQLVRVTFSNAVLILIPPFRHTWFTL